jgi:hypothetical protein
VTLIPKFQPDSNKLEFVPINWNSNVLRHDSSQIPICFAKLEPRKYLIYKAKIGLSTAKFQNSNLFCEHGWFGGFRVRSSSSQGARFCGTQLYEREKTSLFPKQSNPKIIGILESINIYSTYYYYLVLVQPHFPSHFPNKVVPNH